MNRGFWRGKRVLVTGHTGFKGAWLSLWLQSLGAEVAGFALAPPTEQNLFDLAGVADHMHSLHGDVRDADAIARALAEVRPEIVLHLAAQSLVQDSYQRPVETYATNVMGTVHLLEAVRHSPQTRVVVNVTSDKCYRNRGPGPAYREDDPLGGHDPYSSSKGCAELVTDAYRNSFLHAGADGRGVGLASARAGNVIGGGDWARNRLVPDLLQAFARAQPAAIRRPDAVRPWQHVLEPLRGYLMLAEHLWNDPAGVAGAWNFGPDSIDSVAVSIVAGKLVQFWGPPASVRIQPQASDGHEAEYLAIDAAKARSRLGWLPVLALDDALRWTVDWARQFHDAVPARELCLAQIDEYERRANA